MAKPRYSSAPSDSFPVKLKEALRDAVDALGKRLCVHVPFPSLSGWEIDDLISPPSHNASVRNLLEFCPERVHVDTTVEVLMTGERATDEGADVLSIHAHGLPSGNQAPAQYRDRIFVAPVRLGYGTAHTPRAEANPEHLAALRAYTAERFKAGCHAATLGAFVRTVLEHTHSVPALNRVWPELLGFCSFDSLVADYRSRFGNSKGRAPKGWDQKYTQALAGANLLLSRASLLPSKALATGDYEITVRRRGYRIEAPWGDVNIQPQ